jgi:hypothetical protein
MNQTKPTPNQPTNQPHQPMKTTLTTSQIVNALGADKNANWSYQGASALAEYLEEIEGDTGEELELDVVAIRCDYSEHPSLHAWADDYFADWRNALSLPEGMAGAEEEEDAIREYIREHGDLIEFEGGVIVSNF